MKTSENHEQQKLYDFVRIFFISVLSRGGEIEYFCSFSGSAEVPMDSLNETVLVAQCHFSYLKFLS